MNRFIPALLASVLAVAPMHAASAQPRTQTFAVSGTFDGWQYDSVTVHYDTRQITYNFVDGGGFTIAHMDTALFNEYVRMLRRRDANPL